MALRWLTDTARAAAAVDAALSTGTDELWFQFRVKGSYLLDKPEANPEFVRLGLFNTGTPGANSDVTTFRRRISLRKTTAPNYELLFEAAFDASNARSLFFSIATATLDPLLDRDKYYTFYLRAWTTGTIVSNLRLIDDDGTVVWNQDINDGASVLALGSHTQMVAAVNSPELMEIDAVAFGIGTLDVADRFVSPEVHGNALRYWLFEDGSGDTIVEGTGNGNDMVFNAGVEDTDYEWFTGVWGADAEIAETVEETTDSNITVTENVDAEETIGESQQSSVVITESVVTQSGEEIAESTTQEESVSDNVVASETVVEGQESSINIEPSGSVSVVVSEGTHHDIEVTDSISEQFIDETISEGQTHSIDGGLDIEFSVTEEGTLSSVLVVEDVETAGIAEETIVEQSQHSVESTEEVESPEIVEVTVLEGTQSDAEITVGGEFSVLVSEGTEHDDVIGSEFSLIVMEGTEHSIGVGLLEASLADLIVSMLQVHTQKRSERIGRSHQESEDYNVNYPRGGGGTDDS